MLAVFMASNNYYNSDPNFVKSAMHVGNFPVEQSFLMEFTSSMNLFKALRMVGRVYAKSILKKFLKFYV